MIGACRIVSWLAAGTLAGMVSAQSPVGSDALHQFEQLPLLRPNAWAYQSSSHDRGFRNYDWTGFLGWKGSEQVVMDVKGPGCVYRIWFTANVLPLDGTFRFYLDGSPTPTVQISMEELFGGADPWFPAPLVGNHHVSSGGYYCYVPIAYRTGCTITHTNSASHTYFNITYHQYATAEGITTFDGSQPTEATVDQWNNAGADPKSNTNNQILNGTADVAPSASSVLASVGGPGVIQRIELNLPSITQPLLASLRLRLAWDSMGHAVDIPIGPFFGSGLGPADVRGLPVGISGTRLYCYFPMPFRSLAQVSLYNASNTPVSDIAYTIEYARQPVPPNTGRFHAHYAAGDQLPEGVDHNFVTVTGTGHLAGIVQTLRGRNTGQWYLEGDERFYVDGALTPALHGTGTEDLYNGGWYFDKGPFTLPLHGAPMHTGTSATFQANTCYRFFIGDLIPFRNHLRAGIEHGGWNEDPVYIESVAFYYRAPRQSMLLTDMLDVGDPASEAAHQYLRTGEVWSGSASLVYASNGDSAHASDTGRWLGQGGTSRFSVATDPPGGYVVLRRRLNYGVPRQHADVFVNGLPAGTWYDAGSSAGDGSRNLGNPAFRDSDFFIPPALARGKSALDVQIVNTSGESEWTEYRYWAYIVHDGTAAPADFDYDGDVDQEDFAFLQKCLSGSYTAPADSRCRTADLDQDADVDGADVSLFLNCMSGSGFAADSGCANW